VTIDSQLLNDNYSPLPPVFIASWPLDGSVVGLFIPSGPLQVVRIDFIGMTLSIGYGDGTISSEICMTTDPLSGPYAPFMTCALSDTLLSSGGANKNSTQAQGPFYLSNETFLVMRGEGSTSSTATMSAVMFASVLGNI